MKTALLYGGAYLAVGAVVEFFHARAHAAPVGTVGPSPGFSPVNVAIWPYVAVQWARGLS